MIFQCIGLYYHDNLKYKYIKYYLCNAKDGESWGWTTKSPDFVEQRNLPTWENNQPPLPQSNLEDASFFVFEHI